ncbi:MAG: hypothetical protein ACW98A_06870 [Candidatus Hodarchaeales archaeon]|jgi:hypothetical protein
MSNPLQNRYFPSLIFFIVVAIIFLDLGILFGALNAFRLSVGEFVLFGVNILDPNLILLTHWTNTLLGGLSVIMLGQIFFFFSYANEEKFKRQIVTVVVLIIWLLGIVSNYLASWVDFDLWHDISSILFLIGISVYLIAFLESILLSFSKLKKKDNLPFLHLFMAVVWMWIAVFFFASTKQNALGLLFLSTYVFGFFSFTLFGALFFLLPRLFDQKKPSNFTVIFHFILLFTGEMMLFVNEFFAEILGTPITGVIGLFLPVVGTVLYTAAFFVFLLWLADFIFRTGLTPSLGGLLIAMLMMSFFVIDTLMKEVFPQWVDVNHVHFIFLGAILLTLVSMGTKLISTQYSKAAEDEIKSWDFKELLQTSKFRLVVLFLPIVSVGMILLSFTVINYYVAGLFGLLLFLSIILVNIELLIRARS